MELECFDEITKIEKAINEIPILVNTLENLNAQVEAVKKMPQYTSLMQCSPYWHPYLIARIELQIDSTAAELSILWKGVENSAEKLNDYLIELQFGKGSLWFNFQDDLQQFLAYLMVEVNKWLDAQSEPHSQTVAFKKPSVDVERAIMRCKQNLQLVIANASIKP